MGHRDVKGLKNATLGAKFDDLQLENCRVCSLANIRRKRFKKRRTTQATRVLFRVFIDICGPFVFGYGHFIYFMLIVDDFSRYTFIYFLRHRNDALTYFQEYKAAVENYLDVTIVIVRVDNAPEFIEGEFKAFCLKEGIQFEKTVPDASQQNGVVERGNQTVECSMRAMLLDAGLPFYFWPLAAQAAVHIGNRLPHSALPGSTTPFKRWFGQKPDISHLRPFGALVTARKPNSTEQNKVLMRGEEGRFVGYARDSTGYLIYFPESRTIRPRRDVDFHGFPVPIPAPTSSPIGLWKDIPLELENRFRDPNPGSNSSSRVWVDTDLPGPVPLQDIPSSYPRQGKFFVFGNIGLKSDMTHSVWNVSGVGYFGNAVGVGCWNAHGVGHLRNAYGVGHENAYGVGLKWDAFGIGHIGNAYGVGHKRNVIDVGAMYVVDYSCAMFTGC
jgi:hypothetical protein